MFNKIVWFGGGAVVLVIGGVWWYSGFSTAADVATVLGLGVTIWVLVNLQQIEQRYLFQDRAPDLLEDLKQKRSDLNDQLNTYQDSQVEIGETLSSCRGILTTLERRMKGVNGKVRASIEDLGEVIEECPSPPSSGDKDRIREIYYQLVRVTDELDGLISDQQRRQ